MKKPVKRTKKYNPNKPLPNPVRKFQFAGEAIEENLQMDLWQLLNGRSEHEGPELEHMLTMVKGDLVIAFRPKGAVNAVIRVLEFGANKYAENNWKHVPDAKTRYYDAMQRHIDAWWSGEQKDPETGEHHLAHAICCGMFLWWFDDMDTKVMAGQGFAAKFVRKGDLPERGPIDQLGYQLDQGVPEAILEAQALRGAND